MARRSRRKKDEVPAEKPRTRIGTQRAAAVLDACDFNPIQQLVEIGERAKEKRDDYLLLDVCSRLLPYAYPKLKQVELAVGGDKGLEGMIQIIGVGVPSEADRANAEANFSA